MFGPGKPSSLPQIWRNVRKKRKKHRHRDRTTSGNQHDSDSLSDEDKPKFTGWSFNYAEIPPPEQWHSDDEVKYSK